MNSILSDHIFRARVLIVLIALFEWAVLFFGGTSIIGEFAEPRTKFVVRPAVAFGAIGVVWLQGYLYHHILSSDHIKSDSFLGYLFIVQHLVGVVLVLRAAYKLKSNSRA
jgi:hypothetical protein